MNTTPVDQSPYVLKAVKREFQKQKTHIKANNTHKIA